MTRRQKHPPAKCLAIDVDGTLIDSRMSLNAKVADLAKAKRGEGWDVILWSARGRRYAQAVAEKHGIEDVFTAIIGKPGFVVDDLGWQWIKYTRVIRDINDSDG